MSRDDMATLRAVCEAGSENATVLLPKAVVLALLDLAERAEEPEAAEEDAIPAAALLARAEAAGLYLRLGQDGEVELQGPAPGAALLAELRQHWGDLLDLLLLRKVRDIAPPPDWLDSIAAAIRAALEAGAKPEADDAGWMYLATPDGGRLAVAPDTLSQIVQAGLLRPLEASLTSSRP